MRASDAPGTPGELAGIPLSSSTWLKIRVKDCFTGKQMVDWIEYNVQLDSRRSATQYAQVRPMHRNPMADCHSNCCWRVSFAIHCAARPSAKATSTSGIQTRFGQH